MVKNKFTVVLVTMLAVLILAACSKPTATSVNPTTAPTGTIVAPTQTATPASLLLVDPAGAASGEIKSSLQAFAASNGLTYLENPDLAGDLTGVKVAVVFGDALGYKEQAGANSGAQFVFIGATSETAAGNISLIRERPQDLSFLAGYLASLVAEDWRSGGLLSSNSLPIETIGNAFYNGGKYICSYCLPVYPPYPPYTDLYPPYSPIYLDVSGKAAPDMVVDVSTLAQYKLDTLFVTAQADLPEVLDAAEAAGMYLIGENPLSTNAARYAAILDYEVKPALEAMLPQLLAGQGGQTAVAKVVLAVLNNSQKISPARQALFASVADSLAVDEIIPLSVP
jgi:hypothetical protein